MKLLGGIEAGGTKFVCAVSSVSEPHQVLLEERFETGTPATTLAKAVAFLKQAETELGASLIALGIGTFGPAGVNPALENYGTILPTPKPGWQGADFLAPFRQAYPELPISFDTDVNAAALGEGKVGAAKGLDSFVYITVGTGIGGGVVVNGEIIKGYLHPEIGHLSIENHDDYQGCCAFHKNCVEGLASGTAISERWGIRATDLPPEHEAWQLEAQYLASLCQTLTAVLSPQKIILGGGVMMQDHLLPKIQTALEKKSNGYWQLPSNYLVTPALANQAGVIGALEMARLKVKKVDEI